MRTKVARFGLADHGRRVSVRVAESAEYDEGYKYELIQGRLYVSPEAQVPENRLETWLYRKLWAFADAHPDVINYVSNKARVIVPGSRRRTTPEPDIAAYAGYPIDGPLDQVSWADVSPIVVAEVLYEADPFKDLVRNVDLYLRVPSIREYWILDARLSADRPILIVRRRRGRRWVLREFDAGETYTTKTLPDFGLLIDPHR